MTSTLGPLDELLSQAVAIAAEAAALIRNASCGLVQFKGTVDLVTETDRASEELIATRLRERFHGCHLVLEEGGEEGDPAAPTWYVDPLDGTTNFAHGLPHCGVTLALEQEGTLLVGVISDVWREETYAARRGGGARLLDREGRQRPLQVSRTGELRRALLATGFPYDRHRNAESYIELFTAFLRRAQGVRRAGAASLDLAFVARGWLDGFWEMKLQPWDVAAGTLLVQEAGGRVSTYDGSPCRKWGPETVASNSGTLHEAMLEVIRGC